MSNYGKIEREIAKILESSPKVKALGKSLYQKLNYLRYKENNFEFEVNPSAQIYSPQEFFKIDNSSSLNENPIFFGYYDKPPLSKDMNRAIYHRINKDNLIEIILFDKVENKEKVIGTSTTWNYQQGCMLQWVPENNNNLVIFNDIQENELVARVIDITSKEEKKVIPYPIQAFNPNGKEYVSINYKRLYLLKPEYGYSNEAKNFNGKENNDTDGIWKVNFGTGDAQLIVTLNDLIKYKYKTDMNDCEHKVNHVIFSPTGQRMVFMHRWKGSKGTSSRLLVCDNEGKHLNILMDDRMVSHYHWIDDDHIIVWGRISEIGDRYFKINVISGEYEIIGDGVLNILGDGHPSVSPNGRWIITDSYPDKARQRHLILYDMDNKQLIKLGRFYAPWKYNKDVRCDLHPRWSPDGNVISIDSAHKGIRQTFLINIEKIVK